MQCLTVTKKSTERINYKGNLFRKNLQVFANSRLEAI